MDDPFGIIIDLFFLMDILIIMNSAFYDMDMNMIESRCEIIKWYLKGWFWIDFLAIVPFELILMSSGFNSMVRISKIGRLYKLVKITRLIRILKILKEKNKLLRYLVDFLRISLGFERLFFLVLLFMLFIHLFACFWLISASMQATDVPDP